MTTQVASSPKALVTQTSERELRIERIFNASRERVWRAMTDPALVAQWWGRGNKVVVERMDVQRGGHWRFVEHAPDGSTHGFEGRYRELKPMELIEQTFEWDGAPGHVTVETMTLEDLGDGRTKLVTRSLFHTAEDLQGMVGAGMEQGLNETYAALDRLLARPH
ncbi:SRPBCC family protein [Corallococcus sp. EGB]|uniref:SRPBCC family protein n=1 Tax=Corallococcus sp. EGB TaxID=1521117 RepID=UPI001CBC43FA|nr:SRPBCC family protein [Corallococcus sp. EGB]